MEGLTDIKKAKYIVYSFCNFYELSLYFYEWTTNLKEISIIMFHQNTWVKQNHKSKAVYTYR